MPAAPTRNPNRYVRSFRRLAEQLGQVRFPRRRYWDNQFDNVDQHARTHVKTTAPEIWPPDPTTARSMASSFEGRLLAEPPPASRKGLAQPVRTASRSALTLIPDGRQALHSFYTERLRYLERAEGVPPLPAARSPGQSARGPSPAILEGFTPDMSFNIPDRKPFRLESSTCSSHEGLCLGRILRNQQVRRRHPHGPRELGPGHTIVTNPSPVRLWQYGYPSKLIHTSDFLLRRPSSLHPG